MADVTEFLGEMGFCGLVCVPLIAALLTVAVSRTVPMPRGPVDDACIFHWPSEAHLRLSPDGRWESVSNG